MSFTDDVSSLDNHITVLIGKNGSGKSTTLGEVARIYSNTSKGKFSIEPNLLFDEVPARVIAFSSTLYDKFPTAFKSYDTKKDILESKFDRDYFYLGPRSGGFVSNRNSLRQMLDVISLASMQEKSSADLSDIFEMVGYRPHINLKYRKAGSSDNKIKFPKRPEDLSLEIKKYLSSVKGKNSLLPFLHAIQDANVFNRIGGFISDIIEEKEFVFSLDLNSTKNFNDYVSRLKALNIGEKLGLFRLDSCTFVKSSATDKYQEIEFSELSSGEASLILKTITLSALVKDNSLVLMDEPENSLHPSWQIKLIDSVKKAIRKYKGCHIVIATHSPFFIPNLNITDSTIVHVLRGQDGSISGEFYQGDTYGRSFEKVLLDIFDVSTTRNLYFEQRLRNLVFLASSKTKDLNKIREEISFFRSYNLGEDDPLIQIIQKIETSMGDS